MLLVGLLVHRVLLVSLVLKVQRVHRVLLVLKVLLVQGAGAQVLRRFNGAQGATGPVAGSSTQVVYKDGSNNPAGSSVSFTFDGTNLTVGGNCKCIGGALNL